MIVDYTHDVTTRNAVEAQGRDMQDTMERPDHSTAERQAELKAQDADKAAAEERARRNSQFTQVYPKGWRRLRDLIGENPTAARLYAFLAEHIDAQCGAVVASQKVLAEALNVSEITIRRQTKWLEDHRAVVRIRIGSGVYAYALDPTEIWKSWDSKKEHAAFVSKTLVKKADRGNGTIQRKLSVMLHEAKARDEAEETSHDPETGEVREG